MTTNTVPGPLIPRRAPVTAGAMSRLTLSTQLDTTLTATSSSAVRASVGVNADIVGRVMVMAVEAITATAYATYGEACDSSATPVRPIPPACAA